jgi:hypothetical protein
MSRRGFLKLAAGLASIPLIGKYFKWAKPLAKSSKVLTSVPIKDISGMPVWFKPLVNKVIKEGDDVTKKFATQERQIVHKTELPDSQTDVLVTQDLNTGNVSVELGMTKHGFADGHLGQPVSLEYKAGEVIEPTMVKGGQKVKFKHGKTKDEFWVEEAEFTGGHPENIKFEESTFNKFGEHGSNFDEVEKFATGKIKKKTGEASIKAERAHWTPEGDFASGGRVPLSGGKLALDLGLKFLRRIFGKDKMIEMKTRDPEMYQGLLEVVDKFRARDKAGLVKYMKKYLPHMDDAEIEDFIIGSGDMEGVHGQLIRLGSGRDYKGKIDRMKKFEKDKILRDFDVEKATKHATGGRVPLREAGEVMEMDEWYEDPDELEEILKAIKQRIKEGLGKYQTGGRVPLGEGGDPGTSSAEEVREAWKDYLKEKEKGTFTGTWKEWQPIWIRANLAQGGRVPLFGGGRAANWFIKNFKSLIDEAANPGPWSRFSKMGAKDKQAAVADAKEMIKRLEAGDSVPEYLLDDIISDPKFKLKRLKATDPDLVEVENLAEGYSRLKNARENKFRGEIKLSPNDPSGAYSRNVSAALDDYDLFTPTTTDMYGKPWKKTKNWIKEERAKALKTKETIGPAPSSRHPEYRSMVQIRKGLEDRLTALEITEELGGNIKMFDKLRMHNYPSFNKTLDKRDWLMPPGGLKKREAFVIDIGSDTLPPTKHASGGRVPMWLGGGLTAGKRTLAELLKYMSKGSSHGKTPSEMLKMINPKQFNEMLDKPEGIPAIAREMIEKYTKEMKIDRANMIEDLIGTGRKMKKSKDKLKEMDKITEKLTKEFVDKGMDKKMVKDLVDMFINAKYPDVLKIKALPNITDEAILELENIGKNLATKDRKLNASGGRVSLSSGGLAGMLGE